MGLKYKVNEEFFDNWSPEMAYVLGYIYADGSIYRSERGNYLNITSTDRDTIFKIKRWLDSEHFVRIESSDSPTRKEKYVIRIGNKKLYEALLPLGIYPSKSLTIGMPDIPKSFFADFLRGYFDGDGCVNLYRSKGITQDLIIRKLSVIFTSGSKKFLKELLIKINEVLDLKQKKVYKSHRSFQLRFATSDSLKILFYIYRNKSEGMFLKRKFDIFCTYLKLKGLNTNTATW